MQGELQSCKSSSDEKVRRRALEIVAFLEALDLREAAATVAADKRMILRAVQDDGGFEKVEFLVKQSILGVVKLLGSLQRVKDPAVGQRLDLKKDVVSVRLKSLTNVRADF